MLIRKLFFFVKNKFIKIYNTGVEKEKDESKKKYIVLVNIATINSALITFFISCMWLFFASEIFAGFSSIITTVILLIPVYLNSKGLTLTAKKLMIFTTNSVLLVAASIFSYHVNLENYYCSVIVAFGFIFSDEERKWTYISIFITIIYYCVQVTPLHNLLPDLNLLHNPGTSTSINNCGSIIMTLLELIPFIYITHQWSVQMINQQKMLEDTKLKLQVQNDDLQTFSIAASHSLQTPVHISKFFLIKVRKNYDDPHQNAFPKKSIDIIEDSLNQMDQLVSGLFSYASIIKIEESRERCNVINEFVIIKKRMEEKFINGQITIPRTPLYITTNKMLFSIIIQNLIDNALKYNTSKNPAVHLHVIKNENMVSFFITDNGIGIEEKFFTRIFEPFKRINPGSDFAGTGLGLSGAKRAAERIGGKLFCTQSSENGSTFQLDIMFADNEKTDFSTKEVSDFYISKKSGS